MAVDSASSYSSAKADAELKYLQSGWELDDNEAEILHESKQQAFDYMVDIVREYKLPGDLALSDESVKKYVYWKKHNNTIQKIQFFEENEDTYREFPDYWLALASAYYQNKDYAKCINAIKRYQEMGISIFRKDHAFAKVLPLAIASAGETLQGDEYIAEVKDWVNALVDNSSDDEWALRYFAAQTYLNLYERSGDKAYLEESYSVTLNNVNNLVDKQRAKNAEYLSELETLKVPKGTKKAEKKRIENYNKELKQKRKTELPPIYEPFILNCDLLFSLIQDENLDLQPAEAERINGILHPDKDPVFLVDILDSTYWINIKDEGYSFGTSLPHQSFSVDYDGEKLTVPAFLVTEDASITVSIKGKKKTFDDWKIEKVRRKNKKDFESFTVTYESKEAKEYNYKSNDKVHVEIIPKEGMSAKKYRFDFEVIGSFESVIPVPPFNLLDNYTFQVVKS